MKTIQGQSIRTLRKEQAFGGLFRINLTVAKTMPYRYHHFDLNAGCGYNHQVGCEGSPLVFLQTAEEIGFANFAAHFVDKDRSVVTELLQRVTDERSTVYQGDNREFVQAIPNLIRHFGERPEKALGSVLCDPNGTDLPLNELTELTQTCRRLDLILNYPARTWKRERGAGFHDQESFLHNVLPRLNKNCWLIQSSERADPSEWMILVGRNWKPRNAWETMGFYFLDSPRGQDCLRRTLSRYESSLGLFE